MITFRRSFCQFWNQRSICGHSRSICWWPLQWYFQAENEWFAKFCCFTSTKGLPCYCYLNNMSFCYVCFMCAFFIIIKIICLSSFRCHIQISDRNPRVCAEITTVFQVQEACCGYQKSGFHGCILCRCCDFLTVHFTTRIWSHCNEAVLCRVGMSFANIAHLHSLIIRAAELSVIVPCNITQWTSPYAACTGTRSTLVHPRSFRGHCLPMTELKTLLPIWGVSRASIASVRIGITDLIGGTVSHSQSPVMRLIRRICFHSILLL